MTATSLSAAHEKLLASLSPGLRALALRGVIRTFHKASVIINEGSLGKSIYVVLQGKVKVYATDDDAREITYGTIEAGDYFGEMSLDGGPRSASVMTLETCTCSVVSRSAVRDHLAEEPEFALDLVAQVIRRARSATETARKMALMDVYSRLINDLESYKGEASEDTRIKLDQITHQSIASRIGASREMVSRLLKDLEKGGHISLGVKRITLLHKLPQRW